MAKEVLPSGAGDAAIVDGVGGAVVVAGEATGTAAIVEPGRRGASDVIHRTDLSAFATLDAAVRINLELAVCDHATVEIGSQHVRIEARGGSMFQFLNAPFAIPDDGDDMGSLSLGVLNLPGFFLWRVCIHKRQADIALWHDDGEERLCLKTQGAQLFVEDGHAVTHIVSTGGQCPTEGLRANTLQFESADEAPDDMWRLPAMRGEAESDAFLCLECELIPLLSDEIRDVEKWFVEGFCDLLSHPFRVACA